MSEELTRKTLRGATLLVSSQGLSRLLTFIGNVLLVRSMDNDARPLGVSSTQLHLLYVAALAITRDGVRRTCLRELPSNISLEDRASWEMGASLSRAYTLTGIFLITPLVFYHFLNNAPSDVQTKEYNLSLWLVVTGSCFELLSEPMYVVAQNSSMFKLRSSVEAASAMCRAAVGLACSVLFGCKLSAFAWGYFATGITIYLVYALGMMRATNQGVMFPLQITLGGRPSFHLDTHLGQFTLLTTVQSAWKLMLSEGEKIVMIAMGTVTSDRGAYAMAANLGSLAARLVLQPCEEAAFTLFGKLKGDRSVDHLFSVLTRASILFGLVFLCFGTQYTHLLVMLLYGRGWADGTETPYILSWYCVFIAVCAVNGITEAFLQAVANNAETKSFNLWLLFCSLLFVGTSAILLPVMGTSGLVAANSFVMMVRIARNVSFAMAHVSEDCSPRSFVPSPRVLAAFFVGLIGSTLSRMMVYHSGAGLIRMAMHVAIGGALFLMAMVAVFLDDKDLVATLSGRRSPKETPTMEVTQANDQDGDEVTKKTN